MIFPKRSTGNMSIQRIAQFLPGDDLQVYNFDKIQINAAIKIDSLPATMLYFSYRNI